MDPKIKPKEDLYDIKKYSDNELLQILDLANMNPTDRELEAKIIYYINKYNFIPTENAKQLTQFFNDIYDHFFENNESDSEPVIEGLTTQTSQPSIQISPTPSNDIETKPLDSVGLTKSVAVSHGKMNPLLNQTITRVISIDSQFRDNLNNKITTLSTDFTFDLSEPLRDVVSLKLYSIQIPYTWYTIDSAFGSNFFLLEPNPLSLINAGYTFKFDISAGNYTNTTIFTALTDSITDLQNQYPDVSFGTTNFNYNPITAITKLTFDIQNIYNEPQYRLAFDGSHNPFNQLNRNNSLANFLGYSNEFYNTSTLYGIKNYNFNNNTTTPYYYVDASNFSFQIIQYVATPTTLNKNAVPTLQNSQINPNYSPGCPEYTDILQPLILNTFTVSFSNQIQLNTAYSRETLLTDLNNQIKYTNTFNNNYTFLDKTNSDIFLTGITDLSSSFNINDVSYVQMDLKLSRYTTPNIYNFKTVVQFPIENTPPPNNRYVWRDIQNNGTSCFNFDGNSVFQELNNIISEKSPTITNYDISQNPYILLRCIREQYDFSLNDYVIKIANSTPAENETGGYILSQYIREINRGIFYANQSSLSLNHNDLNLPVNLLNHPDISDNQIPTITNYPQLTWNSFCYHNPVTNFMQFQFDITRTFTADKYIIDISNTLLESILGIQPANSDISGNNPFQCIFFPKANGYNFPFNIPLIKILLKNEYTGSPINYIRYDVYMDASGDQSTQRGYYLTASEMINAMNKAFDNFVFYYHRNTKDLSDNPIRGTFLSPIQFITPYYYSILDISINVPLTSEDYQVMFFDGSGGTRNYNAQGNYDSSGHLITTPWSPSGSWATNLYMVDESYNLIDSSFNKSNNQATISSSDIVLQDEILFVSNTNSSVTNVLRFEPIPTANGLYGLYQDQGDNIIYIDVSANYPYQRQELINDLNGRLRQNQFSNGLYSTLGSYFFIKNNQCRFRVNINKIYTANDYNLVFYNNIDFVKCYSGATSVHNVSWDSTLGWILGFRNQIMYNLSDYYVANIPSGIATLVGDSTVALNLYNYFMIILDDFNQNHLNDGLVTITKKDYSIFKPSFSARSSNICNNPDISSNKLTLTNASIIQNFNNNNTQSNLTQNQIYSNMQLLNANQTNNTLVQTAPGPYIKDIFGLIPLKTTGLSPGQPYVEFGGTLQAQERIYFGPVNIHRMHIQLINDHGDVVNLNGQNWSFSLLCEQLYQNKAT